MTENAHSQKILASVASNLKTTHTNIIEKIKHLEDFIVKLRKGLLTWYRGGEDADFVNRGIIKAENEIVKMNLMTESPYFFMAEVLFEDENKIKPIYISKFSLPEENIYSWITPIARLRYSNLGKTSYLLPSGNNRQGDISRKDSYIIRDKKLIKVNYEDSSRKDTILLDKVWQEERTFGLADIIEKLDAYQDDIIRIKTKGSLLISGPAGSGKTTLALHRIAYLAYSPQTAEYYKPEKMLFFVQDQSTKSYFSAILPQLGLKNAQITTFAQWAIELLGLNKTTNKTFTYVNQIEHPEYPLLLYAKHRALASLQNIDSLVHSQDIYTQLDYAYFDFLDEKSFKAYKFQKENKLIDRFDLCLLLIGRLKDPTVKQQKKLILVDEAENYLTEQLQIIKKFISFDTNSIIYIGDLLQQTFPFTIKSWSDAGEHFKQDRHIIIPKVYRITEQIRDYLITKGYDQDKSIPLANGPEVIETKTLDIISICEDIQKLTSTSENTITGIICNDIEILNNIKQIIPQSKSIHFLNILEAQGVEFDNVFLIFQTKSTYNPEWPAELVAELKKVERDLFMVGATRAKKMLNVNISTI